MPASLFAHREFYDQTRLQKATDLPDCTVAMSELKLNKYFQTAVAEPTRKLTSFQEQVYHSANSSTDPSPPITGSMKVIVSSDPSSCRTWILPKSLLARHSTYFADIIKQDGEKQEVMINDLGLREFQNFVDYMHSSIYSLNTSVVAYRAVMENAKAYLLGEKLGVKTYSDAAVRQLYAIFEPLARLRTSNARKSPIRASDIDYICRNTVPSSTKPSNVSGIRKLFFDAVASHWTQFNVLNVDDSNMDTAGDSISWAEVYNAHADFRILLARSLRWADTWRAALLRPVDEYLDPNQEVITIRKEMAHGGFGELLHGSTWEKTEWSRAIPLLQPRVPVLRRNWSIRRREESTETPDVSLNAETGGPDYENRGEAEVEQEQNGWAMAAPW